VHVQLAGPLVDLAEVQAHQRVRVVDALDLPGMDRADGDADLLLQLAAQRLLDASRRLDLAAGKFPVAS
jgi:hypothetical protein